MNRPARGSRDAALSRPALMTLPHAGFGEVDVALDAAQNMVADGILVAQLNDGAAFLVEGDQREALVFGGKKAERRARQIGLGGFQLQDVIFILDAQTVHGIGFDRVGLNRFIQAGEGIVIGLQACLKLLLLKRTVIFDAEPVDEKRQA